MTNIIYDKLFIDYINNKENTVLYIINLIRNNNCKI